MPKLFPSHWIVERRSPDPHEQTGLESLLPDIKSGVAEVERAKRARDLGIQAIRASGLSVRDKIALDRLLGLGFGGTIVLQAERLEDIIQSSAPIGRVVVRVADEVPAEELPKLVDGGSGDELILSPGTAVSGVLSYANTASLGTLGLRDADFEFGPGSVTSHDSTFFANIQGLFVPTYGEAEPSAGAYPVDFTPTITLELQG